MNSHESWPLSVLRPDNHVYGFAVWQLLDPYSQGGTISNQPQAKRYEPDKPQDVCVHWDIERGDLPSDWFQYTVKVLLEPERTFYEQTARLSVISSCHLYEGMYYLTESTYTMTLGALMQLLPRLKQYGDQILPCLDCESAEYCVDKEVDA